MSTDVLGRVIRQRLGTDLPHPVLQRLHGLASGNPFFALEIAKELARSGIPEAGDSKGRLKYAEARLGSLRMLDREVNRHAKRLVAR